MKTKQQIIVPALTLTAALLSATVSALAGDRIGNGNGDAAFALQTIQLQNPSLQPYEELLNAMEESKKNKIPLELDWRLEEGAKPYDNTKKTYLLKTSEIEGLGYNLALEAPVFNRFFNVTFELESSIDQRGPILAPAHIPIIVWTSAGLSKLFGAGTMEVLALSPSLVLRQTLKTGYQRTIEFRQYDSQSIVFTISPILTGNTVLASKDNTRYCLDRNEMLAPVESLPGGYCYVGYLWVD